jgi:hypothetical protein
VTVVTSSGLFASHATAALHSIGFPAVSCARAAVSAKRRDGAWRVRRAQCKVSQCALPGLRIAGNARRCKARRARAGREQTPQL